MIRLVGTFHAQYFYAEWLNNFVVTEFRKQVLEDNRNESHPKFKSQSSKRYLDFMKKAQQSVRIERGNIAETSQSSQMAIDDDISQPDELISDIDPITKKQLEHPVRNKHCNHIYGYDSVLQSVQRNPRLR